MRGLCSSTDVLVEEEELRITIRNPSSERYFLVDHRPALMKALLFSLWSCGSAQEPTTVDRSEAEVRDAVYFVLVDRFANGDPSNDVTVDPNSPSAWHGGDLAGVLQRIEHIDALGVGSVWLSPISATRTEPFDGWGAFHGYWTRELGEIEPRFGTFDEARQLRSQLHARDLRLFSTWSTTMSATIRREPGVTLTGFTATATS